MGVTRGSCHYSTVTLLVTDDSRGPVSFLFHRKAEATYPDTVALTFDPTHQWPLAPHERLPEVLVVPREKTPMGAAARGNP